MTRAPFLGHARLACRMAMITDDALVVTPRRLAPCALLTASVLRRGTRRRLQDCVVPDRSAAPPLLGDHRVLCGSTGRYWQILGDVMRITH